MKKPKTPTLEQRIAGPLVLKDRKSEEYALQLDALLKARWESIGLDQQEWERLVAEAKASGIHKVLGYSRFTDYHEARFGCTEEDARKRWDILPPMGDRGGDMTSESKRDVTFAFPKLTEDDKRVRRLKRDRPDLARLVISGALTPIEAERLAGKKRRQLTINAQQPQAGAASILKHAGAEYARQLVLELHRLLEHEP